MENNATHIALPIEAYNKLLSALSALPYGHAAPVMQILLDCGNECRPVVISDKIEENGEN